MADRPTTSHYGISEYGPQLTADPMDVYRVYNPAMETIDRILFSHEGEIGKLKNRMDAAEAAIDALDKREAAHYQELAQSIANLQQQLNDFKIEVNDKFTTVNNNISNLDGKTANLWTAIRNVVAKVYGGGTVTEGNGSISWGDSGKAVVGNINVFSGTGYLRTRADEQDNDVKVI